jgi:MbtH protein
MSESDDRQSYKVLVNDEEQYSLWPADRDAPLGWRESGRSGTKAECFAFVEEVWTDLRPKSLRDKPDRG